MCCFPAAGCRWLGPRGGTHSQETHCQRRGGDVIVSLIVVFSLIQCMLCCFINVSCACIRALQMITPLSFEQAVSARDALAKAVYGRTFTWLVEKINQSLALKVQ